ncbi:hypothetical protein BIW11_13973 [Tropilaelaps mercedesae]|uniref:Uncharacterized protein n=1 Tax=Tropilaelaps mercedesae TaxID=418985 RepID=A0A1V9WZI6_9ACAR|nr:hypothetical protein BIW11_13973 [Tropilaelaps mercedesae]
MPGTMENAADPQHGTGAVVRTTQPLLLFFSESRGGRSETLAEAGHSSCEATPNSGTPSATPMRRRAYSHRHAAIRWARDCNDWKKVPLDNFCPHTFTSSSFLNVLRSRFSGISRENWAALNDVLREWPATKQHFAQTADVSVPKFPNEEVEFIYKVQLWQTRSYTEDVLRDIIQQRPSISIHARARRVFTADSTRGAATPALQPVRAETGINCIAVDSSRNSAVTSALPMPKKLALEDYEDNLLEQSQMIILIGRNIFRYKNIKAITFSALEMEINEEYQEIAEYGLSRIDVLNSLKESSSFTFSDDDSVVFFNG